MITKIHVHTARNISVYIISQSCDIILVLTTFYIEHTTLKLRTQINSRVYPWGIMCDQAPYKFDRPPVHLFRGRVEIMIEKYTSGYSTMVHGRGCNPHRSTTTFAKPEMTSLMTL